ncbi:MAG: hypothetical protein KKA48_10650, partial [Proteobacteria bacterium]|nr:hypothetical protein [Pseudomonadota bacterium]
EESDQACRPCQSGKFAEKIGLPGILEKRLTIERGATADYEMSEVVNEIGPEELVNNVLNKNAHWSLWPHQPSYGLSSYANL